MLQTEYDMLEVGDLVMDPIDQIWAIVELSPSRIAAMGEVYSEPKIICIYGYNLGTCWGIFSRHYWSLYHKISE
jgi:hypothetical protein